MSAPASPSKPASLRALDETALRAQLRRRGPVPWLHGEVARRMAERLSIVKQPPAQVLDWWATSGGGAQSLRAACPRARIRAVEPAGLLPDVLPSWWERLRRPSRSVWTEDAVPAAQSHLVWANMMLHWAIDPMRVMQQWHQALAVEGFVMFSCFGPDTLRELRTVFAEQGYGPIGVDFVDMHDLGDMLVRTGFADPVMDMETLTLTWDDSTRMLSELRELGHNLHPQRFAGLRTPRWRDRWLELLARRPDGRRGLSFEIVYGHAYKPVPRVRVAEQAQVSLDDMRTMVRRARSPGRE